MTLMQQITLSVFAGSQLIDERTLPFSQQDAASFQHEIRLQCVIDFTDLWLNHLF
jgi:hypothetical protein